MKRFLFTLLVLCWAVTASSQSYTISPAPFQTVFANNGTIVNNACIWTYSAGTTTPIATYSDTMGTSNSNPIRTDSAGRFTAYLLSGTAYKFVYEAPCTPPGHGTVLRTADNISGVPAAAAVVDLVATAGENVSAGQAVYLSDGSASKTAGQVFKADSANAYSSSANMVGITLAAITAGSTGSVRLAGQITGLSALSTGALYYVGTAGALTQTAPANQRLVGQADSATTLVLFADPPTPTAVDPRLDDFRLTLTTGVPVTTADVTAATTLYAAPYAGNKIALYDATGNAFIYTCAQFSIAVPATTATVYDIWAYASSGTCALKLLAWTNGTTRATAIVTTTTGTYTKSGDLTRRYLGSFRTTGVSGQTEDSFAKRFVWNYYNRVPRSLRRFDSTDSWTYSTNAWRQANASTSNQVELVVGVAESELALNVGATVTQTMTGGQQAVSIGEDSTTVPMTTSMNLTGSVSGANIYVQTMSLVNTYPAVGYHFYAWLEYSSVSGTGTFYGDNGGVAAAQSGMTGTLR